MIEDQYYMTSFFSAITIFAALGCLPLLRYKDLDKFPDINLILGTLLLLALSIMFIGLRNPFGSWRFYGDTYKYTQVFQKIQQDPTWISNKDAGFYNYMRFMAKYCNIQTFYFCTALLYVIPAYFSFYKWFKKYAFFAVVLFVSSMSFWPFGINGMRNGLATSFFIFALAFKDKKIIMYSIIALSITFHTSMVLPALALLVAEFYKNTKVLLILWFLSIPISFLLGKSIMNNLYQLLTLSIGRFDGRGDFSNVSANLFSSSSYRIDFIFYSGITVALGYFFIYKQKFKAAFFTNIFNVYLIANTIWMYFIYFPYTNRIAYLSWFLIPILIVYPIVYSKKLNNQSYFMAGAVTVSLLFVWLLAYL